MAPVNEHCELAAAAVSPTDVMICEDGRCYTAPASQVDVDRYSLVCDNEEGGCVLMPDSENGHVDCFK